MAEVSDRIRGLGVAWWGEGRIDTMLGFSPATWRAMRDSGLRMVFLGAESGSEETLERMDKGGRLTPELTLELVRLMAEHGIVPELSFVLGNPPDPEADAARHHGVHPRVKRHQPGHRDHPLPLHPGARSPATCYEEAQELAASRFPETLDEWVSADWLDFAQRRSDAMPWISASLQQRIRELRAGPQRLLSDHDHDRADPAEAGAASRSRGLALPLSDLPLADRAGGAAPRRGLSEAGDQWILRSPGAVALRDAARARLRRLRRQLPDRLQSLPVLVLFPHSRCNCRCVMCDIWRANRDLRELSAADLAPHLVAMRRLGVRWVVLSGGEPLMHSNLWLLCELLSQLGVKITLLSTGLLLARHAADVARWCDEVIVSLDGPPEIHDRIRSVSGAYDRLAAGVAAVRAADPDLPISARCVLQKRNFRALADTIRAARALGLDRISFLAADTSSTAFNRPDGWSDSRVDEVALDRNGGDRVRACGRRDHARSRIRLQRRIRRRVARAPSGVGAILRGVERRRAVSARTSATLRGCRRSSSPTAPCVRASSTEPSATSTARRSTRSSTPRRRLASDGSSTWLRTRSVTVASAPCRSIRSASPCPVEEARAPETIPCRETIEAGVEA